MKPKNHTQQDSCACGKLKDTRSFRCRDCHAGVGAASKTCFRCGETKPVEEFYRRASRGPKGRLSYCKPCTLDWHRWHRLLKKYGITKEQYEALLAEQGGRCAICEATDHGRKGEPLAVDHCHATGKIRGLLCFLCNGAIGRLKDNPELVRRAADYLERTQG